MCTLTPNADFYDLVYEIAPKTDAYRMLMIFMKNGIMSIEDFEKANIKSMFNFDGVGPKRRRTICYMAGKLLDRRNAHVS